MGPGEQILKLRGSTLVLSARGLQQQTYQLHLEPAVSSATPQTLSAATARARARPSQGRSFARSPARCLRAHPAAGAGPGWSHDDTTASAVPRGPPAAGLCLRGASSRSRHGPARPVTGRAARAGVSRDGRVGGRRGEPLRLHRWAAHPSFGVSGEAAAQSPLAAAAPPAASSHGPLGPTAAPVPLRPRCRGPSWGAVAALSRMLGAGAILVGPGVLQRSGGGARWARRGGGEGCPLRRWPTSRCRGSSGSSRRCWRAKRSEPLPPPPARPPPPPSPVWAWAAVDVRVPRRPSWGPRTPLGPTSPSWRWARPTASGRGMAIPGETGPASRWEEEEGAAGSAAAGPEEAGRAGPRPGLPAVGARERRQAGGHGAGRVGPARPPRGPPARALPRPPARHRQGWMDRWSGLGRVSRSTWSHTSPSADPFGSPGPEAAG